MSSFALVALCTVLGASPGEDLAETIVRAGHTKVGVIPSVISKNGEVEATVGSLGPRARTLARDLHNQLVRLSTSGKYKGQFSVVSERVMQRALRDVARSRSLTIDDLGNRRALEAMSRFTGAKGFVTLNFDEQADLLDAGGGEGASDGKDSVASAKISSRKRKPFQKIKTEYVDDDGDEFSGGSYRDVNTLSSLAYMGDSFELRRFSGNTLLNMGLRTQHPQFAEDSHWQFGKGEKWEREHVAYLKSDLDHPFDIDGFPYKVEILVDGEVRKPKSIRDKYVVELNEGEEYAVRLVNETDQPALVALFIDGVNSIDKELREPIDLESGRHWALKPNFTARVSGWYRIDRNLKTQKAEKFEIVPRDESVAAKNGFDENIGLITAIFYSNDAFSDQHIDYPKDDLLKGLRSAFGESQFGTGAGREFEKKLDFTRAKRGLMLAAVSIYYRSRGELNAILAGDSDDILFDDEEVDFIAKRNEDADTDDDDDAEDELKLDSKADRDRDKADDAKADSEDTSADDDDKEIVIDGE